ncbi:MAG: hydrogenase-1 expression HyaE [Rhodospirillaceae bacterium]|nr:hydrogenase-1 expression HyaE [Rhodospirillaceae bacterium]
MFSPLMDGIVEREAITVVDEAGLDAFAQSHGDVVLMVSGDYKRLGEVHDVAVILPELVKAFEGRLTPAIAAPEDERALQARFRFTAFPSLVFLREGAYLGVISRVLDWTDYLREISEILARTPSSPPSFEFPRTDSGAGADAVH